jgi:hypothetical protein
MGPADIVIVMFVAGVFVLFGSVLGWVSWDERRGRARAQK